MKRQPNRDSSNHDRPGTKHRQPIRLILEPLEARRLLAGLNVSVLVDQDGSRSVDAVDTAATNRVVFLDLNNDGKQDATDPVAFTNERGIATFENIAAGDYAVGIAAGNSLQSQAFPVRVEELSTRVGPAANTLIASDDLSRVWAFDGRGRGQLVSLATDISQVQLDGAIVTSAIVGAEAWIIPHSENGLHGSKLTLFNLKSGHHTSTEIRGLNGRVVDKLVKAGNEVVAQLRGPHGIELAKLSREDGVASIGVSASFPNLVTLSGAANQLAIIEYRTDFGFANPTHQLQTLATKLSMLALNDFSVQATTLLPQSAKEISISANGSLVLAAFSTGGVMVLNNDLHLSAVATLAEATGPLLTQSQDGRIVTGNSTNAFEFIVWDAKTWQPTGRTRVTTSPQTSLSTTAISDAILANTGDRLISTGTVGTVASQLAEATLAPVTVSNDGIASVQLGVRVNGKNTVPSASPISTTFLEDNTNSGQLRSKVADADNDTLWFRVMSSPSHGRLRIAPSGEWIYQPSENFNGTDRAVVRVFDGQASSDLALVLNVLPVNDAPSEMRVEVPKIVENINAENAVVDLGYVTVFDVDRGSKYQFETSDDRFQVRNGRIYLVPGAKLDFEIEPSIEIEIIATEDAASGYQISTTTTLSIADVNEPPTAVKILNSSLPENSDGATVGQVQVEDPDGINRFEYVISDSRFIVENGFLKLKPGVELDFEQANSIILSITVSDSSGQTITQPISLTVADRNDAPTAIDVQLRPIEEATPGAVVGTITVNDQDGQAYEYTVSDARFEVVDGELKLKEGQTVNQSVDANLNVTVTATTFVGNDAITATVGIPVVAKKSPYQNPTQPRDVNGDGQVTPLDVLILINYMNSFGPGPLGGNSGRGGSGESPIWVDVNGDGVISPIDILIIINYLNQRMLIAQSTERAEGEASQMQELSGSASQSVVESAGAKVTSHLSLLPINSTPNSKTASEEQNAASLGLACPAIETLSDSEIDQELEVLLDQLTRERLGFFRA